MFISSRADLVNRPVVREPAGDRGSVKVAVGCNEKARFGAPSIGAAVKVTPVKSHPVEISVISDAKPTGRLSAISRPPRKGVENGGNTRNGVVSEDGAEPTGSTGTRGPIKGPVGYIA